MRQSAQLFDSRQVMRRDRFEVFHYREPRSAGVEVHHHDFYEVYFLVDGQVDYWVDGKVIHMQPGDLLLINPQELHRPMVSGEKQNYERIVLWIDRAFLEKTASGILRQCFGENCANRLRPSLAERSMLTAHFGALLQEFYGTDYAGEQAAYGLFLQLMVQINRMALMWDGPQKEDDQLSALGQQVLRYIGAHFTEQITLDTLAAKFYISKYHLSHRFKKETGISIYRYILLRRLMLARQQLLTGEPAGQVCQNCGFSDYPGFYRAFKSEYGVSPTFFQGNRQ